MEIKKLVAIDLQQVYIMNNIKKLSFVFILLKINSRLGRLVQSLG